MQKGIIRKQHGSWVLRFWDHEVRDGKRVRVKRFKKLAMISKDYPNKKSVEQLAWKELEPINSRKAQPEAAALVQNFIETDYLPYVKRTLRLSTYKDYSNDAYRRHVKQRLGNLRLRDFRTVHGQRVITGISKDNPQLSHKTLLRIKSFLSGVFRHAKTEGIVDYENPMRDVRLPANVRRKKFRGDVYTMKEILDIMANISSDRSAFAVVATAAFSGLRLAELRGLQWGDFDYDNSLLHIRRTMWRTTEGLTKTDSSEASVPLLPVLRSILDLYRGYVWELDEKAGEPHGWMFRGERRKTSLNLANLVRRSIVPMLTRCKVCGAMEQGHTGHEFEKDDSIPTWKGWHAFRRSLASNLYGLGVKPKVVQAILRHSDLATTMNYYVDVPDSEAADAMARLSELMGGSSSGSLVNPEVSVTS
jgi:integrase